MNEMGNNQENQTYVSVTPTPPRSEARKLMNNGNGSNTNKNVINSKSQ
jgi:hypothetical protein